MQGAIGIGRPVVEREHRPGVVPRLKLRRAAPEAQKLQTGLAGLGVGRCERSSSRLSAVLVGSRDCGQSAWMAASHRLSAGPSTGDWWAPRASVSLFLCKTGAQPRCAGRRSQRNEAHSKPRACRVIEAAAGWRPVRRLVRAGHWLRLSFA